VCFRAYGCASRVPSSDITLRWSSSVTGVDVDVVDSGEYTPTFSIANNKQRLQVYEIRE